MRSSKIKSIMLSCVAVVVLMLTGCASIVKDMQDCIYGSVGIGLGMSGIGFVPALAADVQLGGVTHPALSTAPRIISGNLGWRDSDGLGDDSLVFPELSVAEPWTSIDMDDQFPHDINLSYVRLEYDTLLIDHSNYESSSQNLNSYIENIFSMDANLITEIKVENTYSPFIKAGTWLPIPIPDIPDDVNKPFSLRELTNFNAGVHLGVFSIRAGVNPLEFVELLFTLFGQGWDERDRK